MRRILGSAVGAAAHRVERSQRCHARRDIALRMEHAPHDPVLGALDVDHQARVARKEPETRICTPELMRIAR